MADEERQIGDADLMGVAHDQVRARALRKSLQRLAENPSTSGALREMAREVLSGRIGLREALRVGAYSEALGERIAQARQEYEQQSPEERERQRAAAEDFLDEQRAEIEREREERDASSGTRRAHDGSDWKL
jgi:hypothetical protein